MGMKTRMVDKVIQVEEKYYKFESVDIGEAIQEFRCSGFIEPSSIIISQDNFKKAVYEFKKELAGSQSCQKMDEKNIYYMGLKLYGSKQCPNNKIIIN